MKESVLDENSAEVASTTAGCADGQNMIKIY